MRSIIDDILRAQEMIERESYRPPRSMRIHPEDLDDLRIAAGPHLVAKTKDLGNFFNGVELIPDPLAPRLPRKVKP